MSRPARVKTLAIAAVVAAIAALPAAAADSGGVQVVEAGTALFPDRSYVVSVPGEQKSVLTTDDVKVTEDGKPVRNLSVLSSASAEGIGTVLLIDSSNSMRGSIGAAMEAARLLCVCVDGVCLCAGAPTISAPAPLAPALAAATQSRTATRPRADGRGPNGTGSFAP